MKIGHTKRQLRINLIFGVVWLSYFIIRIFICEVHLIDYGWIFISLVYFINYFYQKNQIRYY